MCGSRAGSAGIAQADDDGIVRMRKSSGVRPFIEVVRATLRAKDDSPRTEDAYVGWIRRFIRFHQRRHPRTMGESEVVAFLSSLAVEAGAAASMENQPLSALVFLYGDVLRVELDWVLGLVRAKRPTRGRLMLLRP